MLWTMARAEVGEDLSRRIEIGLCPVRDRGVVELMEITNPIEMPWEGNLSVNHMRFGPRGRWHRRPEVQAWMQRLGWEVEALQVVNWGLPITVIVDVRFPDDRRRDDHNYHKAIADAVAQGLGIDDRDLRIRTGSVVVDRENPGFTITVTDKERSGQ